MSALRWFWVVFYKSWEHSQIVVAQPPEISTMLFYNQDKYDTAMDNYVKSSQKTLILGHSFQKCHFQVETFLSIGWSS